MLYDGSHRERTLLDEPLGGELLFLIKPVHYRVRAGIACRRKSRLLVLRQTHTLFIELHKIFVAIGHGSVPI